MRCVCGYELAWHPGGGQCPLCACGKLPTEHLPVAEPAAPLLTWEGKQLAVCPGKPRTAAGHLPTLRRGSFREQAPMGEYERRPMWGPILFPVAEPDAPAEPLSEPQALPQVPARYTVTLDEIAPRATPVGKQAASLGWKVDPWYYRSAAGVETSVLVLSRGKLRAAASWERAPGGSWKTAGAIALPPGSWPLKVGVKRLVEIIIELG